MKVACIQMDVLHCKKQENLENALYMALEAVEKGVELVVFPEVFSTGFCYENLGHVAESFPSPVLENLACFSEANDCIILGSIIQKDSGEKCRENGFRENGFTEEDSEENGAAGKENNISGKKREIPESKNSAFYYNLGFCFESGTLAGTYRKTHPFKKKKIVISQRAVR